MIVRRLVFLSCLIIFTASWLACTDGARPKIDDGPLSVNVSVKDDATFTCNASNTTIVKWFVNETSIDDIPGLKDVQNRMLVNATVDQFDLTMNISESVTKWLNNSLIHCVGFYEVPNSFLFQPTNNSAPGRLLIQDTLDAPTNFSVVPLNEAFALSWFPPFALDGIGFHYLVTTTVFIASATDHMFSNETSEKYFIVQTNDSSNCTLYDICVRAVTHAGLGKEKCKNTTLGVEAPETIKKEDSNETLEYGNDYINLTYEFELGTCYGKRPSSFVVEVVNNGIERYEGKVPDPYTNSTTAYTVSLAKNSQGSEISAVIILTNDAGSSPSQSLETYISYVKDINISSNGSGTNLSCLYWPYSNPNGCSVEYECSNHSDQFLKEVTTLENDPITFLNRSEEFPFDCNQLHCSHYNLYAYENKTSYIKPSVVKKDVKLCIIPGASSSTTPTPSTTPSDAQSVHQRALMVILISVLLPVLY